MTSRKAESDKRSRVVFFRAHPYLPPHESARITPSTWRKKVPPEVLALYEQGTREWNSIKYYTGNRKIAQASLYNAWRAENSLRRRINWQELTFQEYLILRENLRKHRA